MRARTLPRAPIGHLDGLRGRLFLGVTVKPRDALLSVIVALALIAIPLPSLGQQLGKVYRIGWLSGGLSPKPATPENCPLKGSEYWQAWVQEMRERGYFQGQNLVVECRFTERRNERAAALAAELVSLKVDLIVANNTNQVRAAMNATRTIPILMHGVIDPVGRGLVPNLARPGGNVTGVTEDAGTTILGKYLELLTQAVPGASRMAVLRAPGPLGVPELPWFSMLESEARPLGVTLKSFLVQQPEELEGSFVAMTKARAEALLIVPSPFIGVHRQRIVALTTQRRLPAMYPDRADAEAGGLMAYAVNLPPNARRLAAYVDRILKGTKPGDQRRPRKIGQARK